MEAEKNSLVSIAKIASTSEYIPPRILRFMLQSAARELLPNERVAKCFRAIVPTAQRVEIHKAKQGKAAHYRNLLVCSRIWHCPVCAAKISEERRLELSRATKAWIGDLVMVTFTMSHHSNMPLKASLDKLLTAHRDFKSGRWFDEMREYFGWNGSVKALEITYGANGWHPHIHELVFVSNKMSENTLKLFDTQTTQRWRHVLKKLNMFASIERGVTVKQGDSAVSEYVGKFGETDVRNNWTFAHELTKQIAKKGKLKGRSPTQLLYEYMMGNKGSGKLWQEYAIVCKGKHQLVWSRGMRDMLKLGDEQTDEQIAESIPKDTYLLATITRGQWMDVLHNDAVGLVLQAASEKDDDDFKTWLQAKFKEWAE